jgi:ribulose-phosphate 3-epimerase
LRRPALHADGVTHAPILAPSLLASDHAHLASGTDMAVALGLSWVHIDIMDGHFVPNLTFGPDVVAAVRSHVTVPFEAHLMVHEPAWMFGAFVDAGCDTLIVHAESVGHLHRALSEVREAGARVGVALNPATPVSAIDHVLDLVDLVLVMTVNPGFGGQAYIATMEPKVAEVRRTLVARNLDVDLEVDGGIGPATVSGAAAAGANYLVAGSSLFNHAGGLAGAVSELRSLAEQTRPS